MTSLQARKSLLWLAAFLVLFLIIPGGQTAADGTPKQIVSYSADQKWKERTEVAVESRQQCQGLANTSYRLHFRCAADTLDTDSTDQFNPNCDGANVLVCHLSHLHPRALLSEEEGDEVLRRPNAEVRIINAKANEIIKDCRELMTDFKGKPLTGFRVTRKENKFEIELPYGDDSDESFKIKVPSREFLINFGIPETPMKTFIEHFDEKENKWLIFKGEPDYSEDRFVEFQKYRKEGMPVNIAKHLWMLWLDILPFEAAGKIEFHTIGKTNTTAEEVCRQKKEENGLEMSSKPIIGLIDAKFYAPKDPTQKANTKQANTKHANTKHEGIEKMNEIKLSTYLAKTQFLIHGRVHDEAKKFTIRVYLGKEDPDEILGTKLMEVSVTAAQDKPLECKLISFLPTKNEDFESKCNADGNKGFLRGKVFWLWFKSENGNMDMSINCLTIPTKKWDRPMYSKENHISFEGDVELFAEGGKLLRAEKGLETNSGNSLDGKETFFVHELGKDGKFTDGTLLLVDNKVTDGKVENLEMTLIKVNTADGKKKNILQIVVERVDNGKCNQTVENNCKCMSIAHYDEFDDDMKKDGKKKKHDDVVVEDLNLKKFAPACPKFNLMLVYKEKKVAIYLDGKKLVEGIDVKDLKQANYLKLSGAIGMPDNFPISLMKSQKKTSKFTGMKITMQQLEYAIVYGLFINMGDENAEGLNFIVRLFCGAFKCYDYDDPKEDDNKRTTLSLKFDLKKKCISAFSFETEDETRKPKLLPDGNIPCKPNQYEKFPISPGKKFWLKILVDKDSKKFHIFLDGKEKLLEIKYANRAQIVTSTLAEKIQVTTDPKKDENNIYVLNSLQIFPYRKKLEEKSENTKITFDVRFLMDKGFSEFFLAKDNSKNDVEFLGLGKAEDQKKSDVFVYLHAKAVEKTNDYCVDKAFNPNPQKCLEQKLQSKFVPGETYTVQLTFITQKKLHFQITGKSSDFSLSKVLERSDGNILEATHLVLNGDIALMRVPKSHKPKASPPPPTPPPSK